MLSLDVIWMSSYFSTLSLACLPLEEQDFLTCCFATEPVSKVAKKAKPQKGAFASIFKKANQREMPKASPGRKRVSSAAKETTKTGNFTCVDR